MSIGNLQSKYRYSVNSSFKPTFYCFYVRSTQLFSPSACVIQVIQHYDLSGYLQRIDSIEQKSPWEAKSLSYPRNSPPFMEPEGSLPRSQQPARDPVYHSVTRCLGWRITPCRLSAATLLNNIHTPRVTHCSSCNRLMSPLLRPCWVEQNFSRNLPLFVVSAVWVRSRNPDCTSSADQSYSPATM
jgi:hypothetical protein